MQELESENQAGNDELCLLLGESETLSVQVVPQVATLQVLHHQVGIILVVESVVEVDDERMDQFRQDVHLFLDSFDTSQCVHLSFV